MKKVVSILCLFFCSYAFAQTPSFYAQVSKNKVVVGEVFQIAFTLNGAGNNLIYSNLRDFNIIAGPNQSQSMSIVNGNISQSTTISFFISAKKEGKIIIGPASVMANGNQKLESEPIVLEVTKSNSQTQSNNASQQNNTQNKNQYASEIGGDDLFVRTYLSKTKCFIGEQITLTQKIYSRVDLRGIQNVKFPPYNGFWSQIEENDTQISLQQENVNGINYYVADYNVVYLFPQRSGTLTIDPVELECIVRRQTQRQPRNIFEQFFGAGGYEDVAVKAKSKLVKVEVSELPENNKPLSFNGQVGYYTFKTEINKTEVKADDAFNLKLTIMGRGNIKLLDPPKFNLPESFEKYEPKITENIKSKNGISGTKSFDYVIIPREKGEFVLNDISFSYFDPEKKLYVNLPSPEIKINVFEGVGKSAKVYSPSKNGENENDIQYIATGSLELQKHQVEFFGSTLHYCLIFVPLSAFALLFFITKKRIETESDLITTRKKKAASLAKKQLAVAEKYMLANYKDDFFNEILNALHHYLENKLALLTVDLSKERISELLIQRGVDAFIITSLIDTLNICEYAKYAPNAVTGDLKKVYNDTLALVSEIENHIKK